MYIGPWQEYKLSKQQGNATGRVPRGQDVSTNATKADRAPVSSDVLKELEKVLHKTLDHDAAEVALKAMNQVLSNRTGGVVEAKRSNNQYGLRSTKGNDNYNLPEDSLSVHVKRQRYGNGGIAFNDDDFDTPRRNIVMYPPEHFASERQKHFVPMMVLSARDKYNQNHQPSPLSVRSSKSEPIQSLPSLINVTPAMSMQKIPQYSSLNSRNLAINQQRLQQQKDSTEWRREKLFDQAVDSAPSTLKETPVGVAAKSGYDTGALVNFLRMERNQRAKSEISKLTGWNILHGGSGISSEVRNSLMNESSDSGRPLVPVKDKTTILREKKIAEVEQMKAMYLQGASKSEFGVSGTFGSDEIKETSSLSPGKNRTIGKSSSIHKSSFSAALAMSPIPSPRLVDIENLDDGHLLMISKYFQEELPMQSENDYETPLDISKGQAETINSGDYISLSLEEVTLKPSNSMAAVQPLHPIDSINVSHVGTSVMAFNDDDDHALHSVSQVASERNILKRTGNIDRKLTDDEEEEESNQQEYQQNEDLFNSPSRTKVPNMFSPPDTAGSKVLATGSLMDDLNSGNLDSLLSWTRQLDNFDIDTF